MGKYMVLFKAYGYIHNSVKKQFFLNAEFPNYVHNGFWATI